MKDEKKSLDVLQPEVRDALKNLGFTEYFVNIYITLLDQGELNAHDLSKLTGVPYSRIYEVLNDMVKRGMITKIDGRPSTFISNDPEDLFKYLKQRQDSEFDINMKQSLPFLNTLFGTKKVAKKIEFTMYEGEQACRDHLRNIINATSRILRLKIKEINELLPQINMNLDFMRTKGVEVKIILEERFREDESILKLKKYGKVRFLANISHDLIISDDVSAIQGLKGSFNIAQPNTKNYIIFSTSNDMYIMYNTELFKGIWDIAIE